MKKQHRKESGISELNHTTQLQDLENAQQKSLDDCAVALQSIAELEKLAIENNQPNIGNIHDAQEFLRDAIAYIAIFASKGQGSARIKEILSKYGLEDWF